MTSTTGLVTFTATAAAGTVFQTSLPTSSHSSVSVSILSGGGVNPIEFHASHAIQLLVVQLVIIIALSRGLHWGFTKICPWTSQPRVCFEILAGILLGPTAFGQIPGFSETIFPTESLPFMNLLATIGLVLFLFVIGLEVDFTLFRRNLKPSLSVSLAGLIVPFALGWAVSIGLYRQFVDPSVKITTFSCFIATSSSITAFPVLGRILVDLKLMSDPVGVVVLASGVANDVIGWMLLALSVALATAGSGGGSSGIVVLYILLTTVAWMLFLFFLVRPLLNLVARKTNSFNNPDGPSQTYILAVLMAVLISGWFMAAIGISEIFGGFLVGLIVPSSLGHHIAAKIEDLCICIFIPLYFAYSGLRTNLTLLNSGIIWGWCVCVIAVAFCGKFFGCFFAARFTGFNTRESISVGCLMSAKGLIELIILNQGLSVGIINETVFSIFVLEALLLTLAATPGTLLAYPAHLRRPAVPTSSPQHPDSLTTSVTGSDASATFEKAQSDSTNPMKRITVVLDKLEGLGALFVFTNLLSTSRTTSSREKISINPLRLVELTERLSGVLLASDAAAEHLRADPLTLLYRTFAELAGGKGGGGIAVKEGEFAVTQSDNFSDTVKDRATRDDSDLIIVPWTLDQGGQEQESVVASYLPNPFAHLFGNSNPASTSQPDSSLYASFLRDLFASASCDVGLFFDRGVNSIPTPTSASSDPSCESGSTNVLLPFFGGSDDRACLALAVQLVRRSPGISVTVLVIQRAPEETEEDKSSIDDSSSSMRKTESDETNASTLKTGPTLQLTVAGGTHHSSAGGEFGGARIGETLYPTQHGLASETEDDLLLEQTRAIPSTSFLGKLEIVSISTAFPLKTFIRRAASLSTSSPSSRFVFLVGRSRRDASSHRIESLALLKQAEKDGTLGICASQEVRRCVGEAASAALISGIGENVWVVQSGKTGGKRAAKTSKTGGV
ncbi:uncharacterized protein JCM6883_005681 [Sporobolomyces salmoneus]|uniref:uncharacterized protein n=1 Tax=Sporobolomyces salmoneus TaxID=183962 RepID=UPI00316D0E46